jgi:hypothetical protein
MSAWERSKHIPWERVPVSTPAEELEAERERIFRELQRERIEEELLLQERRQPTASADYNVGGGATSSSSPKSEKLAIPFSTMELLRQVAFGGTIGSVTGSLFGFMDSMRAVQENTVLVNLSNVAKSQFLLKNTTRNAILFGTFFAGYHVTKYGIRIVAYDPGLPTEVGVGSALSLAALAARPQTRAALPYATMLLGLDAFHIFYRENK